MIPSPLPSPSINSASHQNKTSILNQAPSSAVSRRMSSTSTFSTHSSTPTASTTVSRTSSTGLSSHTSLCTGRFPAAMPVQNKIPRALIQVRDFAFEKTDERFHGAGALVPRANHLAVLLRKLVGLSDDDDNETDSDEGDAEDIDAAWDRLQGRWSNDETVENGLRQEVDLITLDTDWDEERDGEEEPLYPGLYRAICAFEPEGPTEMALAEDQIVRVIGRGGGGGVGWVVVVDDSVGVNEDGEPILALVPESYLEAIELDWGDGNENA
ncbi:hypothetical protein C0993_007879 [Termitomyces sp. T159_Od127]|nr:hypothetical protein C0993_007879 [Termitomyces sp. T159_Od127]